MDPVLQYCTTCSSFPSFHFRSPCPSARQPFSPRLPATAVAKDRWGCQVGLRDSLDRAGSCLHPRRRRVRPPQGEPAHWPDGDGATQVVLRADGVEGPAAATQASKASREKCEGKGAKGKLWPAASIPLAVRRN
ncbi:hypothetical protein BO71DRAFT_212658 [Aspergillus ellipticus CBS 707.79]|uniref:Uncharacterized protein n=1 Tax=Aspergillus ellipticus CBS 707.79 TaxID=1448320 RepID=A0A319DCJ4_9EURO|nr:hypothetical protein BO71DRAFT_212658 [Aspergillus ellipticus CBS 707.79]